MDAESKTKFLLCPKCGGKTRTQVRSDTRLINFPLFCPKCRNECLISFEDGALRELRTPSAGPES